MGIKRLVFCSGRGGSGKSVLTVGIGRALAARGKRVVLLDLDLAERSLDMLLGCEDRVVYDLGDLLASRRAPLGVVISPDASDKLFLIPGAYHLRRPPTASELERVIGSVERTLGADMVLIDTASPIDPSFAAAVTISDAAVSVMRADPLGIRSAASLSSRLSDMGREEIQLVVNGISPHDTVDLREIADTVRGRPLGVVPMITDFSLDIPHASFVRATENIAARLLGEASPLLDGVFPEAIRRRILQN